MEERVRGSTSNEQRTTGNEQRAVGAVGSGQWTERAAGTVQLAGGRKEEVVTVATAVAVEVAVEVAVAV